QCTPYLREQIRLIKPKIMCALGRIAAQALLNTTTPLGRLRGQWHQFESIPLLVTYHPAALLRFPQYKKDTWADMQMIMARLNETA
ncbi:uracil-DNA glycosylase, partial [candidate division GN15 bacterium]|nr:uracil-DNA glycosylase [candidate division GN15 bacterium]